MWSNPDIDWKAHSEKLIAATDVVKHEIFSVACTILYLLNIVSVKDLEQKEFCSNFFVNNN